jgi:hypothetical protein
MALIGVGSDKAIDRHALSEFAQAANCLAVTLGGFELLEDLFLRIAVKVTTSLVGVPYSVGGLTWTEVRRLRSASLRSLDFGVLLDRSGSMFNE